uniref:Macaca fascicularis brain cDNA clone: QtrA-16502, similar to human RNA terminal phosphate cyclase domain 1 (RTCD1), mRNA, RefSeq: NM_003729.1 n=1 Tax=Macaca fascicularis TaxID=9541 RepID=I7G9F6_MACFA|nr:unnamed protein product [Macaca fascicularis]
MEGAQAYIFGQNSRVCIPLNKNPGCTMKCVIFRLLNFS